ncbi:hypothetical protein C2845_PM06G24930 [Panicum miliaceum]|uniref:Uncharacterized protein n=1 Tax=Panicum miliaceum TaxID=4540 RepID=A0A3L6RDQ2_PANMI|nr:hypothetical protein C2845_PM06G24930 [Panicum miliaceum]
MPEISLGSGCFLPKFLRSWGAIGSSRNSHNELSGRRHAIRPTPHMACVASNARSLSLSQRKYPAAPARGGKGTCKQV